MRCFFVKRKSNDHDDVIFFSCVTMSSKLRGKGYEEKNDRNISYAKAGIAD